MRFEHILDIENVDYIIWLIEMYVEETFGAVM